MSRKYDKVIKNGTIIDGLRTPRYLSDIGIKDGKVAYIGSIRDPGDAEVIDAEGLIVAPGFVDLHTHYDSQIYWDPYCTIGGWHGITSVVIGNCGFSFAPCKPKDQERLMQMMERNEAVPMEAMKLGMPWDWETFPEFLDSIERTPKGVNVLSYVGISPMVAYAMGSVEEAKSRRPNEQERAHIRQMFNEALDAGACGYSLQYYGPGHSQVDYDGTPFISDVLHFDDVALFAEVLRDRQMGFIQILCKPEVADKLAEISGRPVIWNTLTASRDQHGMQTGMHKAHIEWLKRANAEGRRVFASAITSEIGFYFALENWNLFDGIDSWRDALLGTVEEKMAKLDDPERRQRFREEFDRGWGPSPGASQREMQEGEAVAAGTLWGLSDLLLGYAESAEWKPFTGYLLGKIAEEKGMHIVDVFIDISLADNLQASFETPLMKYNVEEMTEVVRCDTSLPGISDGGAHQKFSMFGSYPTIFLTEMVRDHKMVDLEEGHWRLSALPAQAAGLKDRGSIREGMPADIVIYNLEELELLPAEIVHDFPGGDWRRIKKAKGYHYTIVNGEITFIGNQCTGATPGQLLRWGAADQHQLALAAE